LMQPVQQKAKALRFSTVRDAKHLEAAMPW
jgi:hypothetical protein